MIPTSTGEEFACFSFFFSLLRIVFYRNSLIEMNDNKVEGLAASQLLINNKPGFNIKNNALFRLCRIYDCFFLSASPRLTCCKSILSTHLPDSIAAVYLNLKWVIFCPCLWRGYNHRQNIKHFFVELAFSAVDVNTPRIHLKFIYKPTPLLDDVLGWCFYWFLTVIIFSLKEKQHTKGNNKYCKNSFFWLLINLC